MYPIFRLTKGFSVNIPSTERERKQSTFFGTEREKSNICGLSGFDLSVCVCLDMCVKRLYTLPPGLCHNGEMNVIKSETGDVRWRKTFVDMDG